MPRPSRGPSFAPPSGPPSPFILSYGVSPAPPSGLVFGGLRFRSPKPWGRSMLDLAPGPSRALSFCPEVGAAISLWGSSGLGAPPLSVPSNSCSPPLPLPHLSVYLLSALPQPRLNSFSRSYICWRPPHCYIVLFSTLPYFHCWVTEVQRCERKRNLIQLSARVFSLMAPPICTFSGDGDGS